MKTNQRHTSQACVKSHGTFLSKSAYRIYGLGALLAVAMLVGLPLYFRASAATTTANPNPALANIQFSPTTYTVAKNAGFVILTVTRTGDTSQAQTIRFSTVAGSATAQSGFQGTAGTITFNAGETTGRTIYVLITNNSFVEGNRMFTVVLTDPDGGTSSGPGQTATVTITETNRTTPTTNPIDQRDFFVRQQYRDFLNRDPDASGFEFWKGQYDQRVNACLSLRDQTEQRKCVLRARASISSAFFLSIEFQQTGYLVYRAFDVAFGRVGAPRPALGQPVSQTAMRLEEFLVDVNDIGRGVIVGQSGYEQTLETNTVAFLNRFVQRSAFIAKYPTSQTAGQFVDALFATADVTPSPSDRQAAYTAFGSGGTAGRAAALRAVAENEFIYQREFNRAFVLLEYFGYLRRNPVVAPDRDLMGYNFWLRRLDSFSQAGENVRDFNVVLNRVQRAEMIEGFIDSDEYRSRFGPGTTTGTNVTAQSSAADARVTFSQVTTAGNTTFTPINPPSSAGTPPQGYTILDTAPAYDITTTASYTPPVTVCLTVSAINSQTDFARVRILHGENGQLVDRTSPAPDFATRQVCARVNSLSPFVAALAPTAPTPTTNPIDDARTFVRQQYLDFLNREPDQGGFDYWTSLITSCPSGDTKCVNSKRVTVSAAFFIEQEFQDTGSFVYRFYKGSLARQPNYSEFVQDRSRVIGGTNLEASKSTFADAWTQRAEFLAKYPATLTATQFVDALLQTIKQTSNVDLTGQRQTFINQLQAAGGTRGQVIRAVVDAKAFQAAEYNRAFVLMQYFGYLRRDPDTAGYQFWLDILNNRVPNNYRSMVCAFITSAEYQLRFGSVVTRTDQVCGQIGQ